MKLLRIYLGRHGQTDWNASDRLQGWTDIPLNETGRSQALLLAERMKGIPLDAVYCSGLQRSRQTAELAATGAPITSLADLNEQRLGKYEGLVLTPEVIAEFKARRSNGDDSLDGGESKNQHILRIRRALDFIRRQHTDGGAVMIVGHGGTNNLILQILFGPSSDMMFRFSNTELLLIELPQDAPPVLWRSIVHVADM
jgi:broad specificity phosphatase PhoE